MFYIQPYDRHLNVGTVSRLILLLSVRRLRLVRNREQAGAAEEAEAALWRGGLEADHLAGFSVFGAFACGNRTRAARGL